MKKSVLPNNVMPDYPIIRDNLSKSLSETPKSHSHVGVVMMLLFEVRRRPLVGSLLLVGLGRSIVLVLLGLVLEGVNTGLGTVRLLVDV